MADIVIDSSANTTQYVSAGRGGPFWITTLIGYIIYRDDDGSLVYSKTTDGGQNWAAANTLCATIALAYDCWADWQTEGDAGTKIHIACIESATDTIMYIYLDTSDDSEGTDTIEAAQGDGTILAGISAFHDISITKTRGGNLAVAFHYRDNSAAYFYGFYTSPDGDTWTSSADPWESSYADWLHLYPANLADNNDLWAVFWDVTANEISLKTYDDSEDSWAEDSIAGSMYGSSIYPQMSGAIRLSDGHLILAAWSQYDNAAADLMTWDITNKDTITAKTNVITDTIEYFHCSVFIDQDSDDIYVAYLGGASAQATVDALYKKSTDGMANWGSETILSDDAQDDHRWISTGAVKASLGGRFEPVWFDDDDDDIFTTYANSVEIAASGGGQEVTPSPITAEASIQAPSVSGSGSAPITASAVQAAAYVQAPVLSGTGSAPISATPVQVVADVPAHVASTGDQFLTASPVQAVATVVTPSVAFLITAYPQVTATQAVSPEDDVNWTNPDYVKADDGNNAFFNLLAAVYSYRLKVYNFGFSLPVGATINGILVAIERSESSSFADVKDYRVQLLDADGNLVGSNKASTSEWPTSMAVKSYGGFYDTWSASPDKAMVEGSNFGVVLSAYGETGNYSGSVDFIRITVCFSVLNVIYSSPVQAVADVPTHSISGSGSTAITASPVSVGASVPTHTAQTHQIVEASPVTATTSVQSPTVSGSGSAPIIASPVTAVAQVVSPSVAHSGQYIVSSPVSVASSIPTPTLAGTGVAQILASIVTAQVLVVTPLVSSGALYILASPIPVAANIIAHTVSGSGSAPIVSSYVQVVASVFLASIIMPGRVLTVCVVTSLYRNVDVVTSQYHRVKPVTSLYRKAKVITSGG